MAIRRREIEASDLEGYALEELACVSCTGACLSKIWALFEGEPLALCGACRKTAEFLERFNEAQQQPKARERGGIWLTDR